MTLFKFSITQTCEEKCRMLYSCIPMCMSGHQCLKNCKSSNEFESQEIFEELFCQSDKPIDDLKQCLGLCLPNPLLNITWDLNKKIPNCRINCVKEIKPCLQEMSTLEAQNTQDLNQCLNSCSETFNSTSKNRLCSEKCVFEFILI